MSVKINVKKAERKVLEEGAYALRINKVEQRTSKQGNPMLYLELVPDDEYHPEDTNARIFENVSLVEDAWFRVVDYLKAIMTDVPADDEGDFEFEPEDWAGAVIGANLGIDSYQGIPRNRVLQVFPVDGLEDMEYEGDEDLGGEED